MAFPFIILISAFVFFLQNIQWIKTFTEAIASNRSDHWRQTAKVSVDFFFYYFIIFKSQTCLEYPKNKKLKLTFNERRVEHAFHLLTLMDKNTFFFVAFFNKSTSRVEEMQSCQPADRKKKKKKIETKSLGADWVYLPYDVAFTHWGFLRENNVHAEWAHF